MTQRDPHADNELIDQMAEEAGGGASMQNDTRGGNLARDVGSRAGEKSVEDKLVGDEVDRPRASDKKRNWQKGEDTIADMPTSPH
jgi:hypothetical protein